MTDGKPLDPSKIRDLIVVNLPDSARATPNPVIYGRDGCLDSLGLVNFLADLEYRIAAVYGREVVLASEQAMSRNRSPFRDVDALTEYLVELLGVHADA